ncbi:MAG: hypothetical protein FJZ63_00375 [Chlamydiae bacterium]|nr:hypothetical protein [Chlamydiota bacterium]
MSRYLIWIFSFLVISGSLHASSADHLNQIGLYTTIIEKLIYYKNDRFTVFYGGPVTSTGVRWVMYATFEDADYETRAVYEVAFVNCNLEDARGAKVLFVDIPDINIKFKNELSDDYRVFRRLYSGEYSSGKYIVVRAADVAMPYYPNIYLSLLKGEKRKQDQVEITQFLHKHYKTRKSSTLFYVSSFKEEIDKRTDEEVSTKPIHLQISLDGKKEDFYLVQKVFLKDPWKLYYLVTNSPDGLISREKASDFFVRIDSGCASGQIYDDDSCDCLDQLHNALASLRKTQGMIIHIPAQDGRGYGSALKAETEIYKRGGKGRVRETTPLDTIAAARYLYRFATIDLRTYDGIAYLLKSLGYDRIILATDNRLKCQALNHHGIEVSRRPTYSIKKSCEEHLAAKKCDPSYFSDKK